MKRRSMLIGLALVLALLWFVGGSLLSARVLSDLAAHPVIALVRGDGTGAVRVPVATPGGPVKPGEARGISGRGTLLGYDFDYLLPDGATVTCRFRMSRTSCAGGWHAERAAP